MGTKNVPKKITDINSLKEKKLSIVNSSVDNDYIFLETYICCEQIAKRIVNWNRKYSKKNGCNLSNMKLRIDQVRPGLDNYFSVYYDTSIDHEIVDQIFYSKIKFSARNIRNSIGHSLPEINCHFSDNCFEKNIEAMNEFISWF